MPALAANRNRIRSAWQGRVSGCILGKSVEVLSLQEGRDGLGDYLHDAGALPLRDYIPSVEGTIVGHLAPDCCKGQITRAEPDDDINYTFLALLALEDHGTDFDTTDVARAWLRLLPAGTTWTAERAAYATLLARMDDEFVNGSEPGFDLDECSDNKYNEWIGGQIRADLYGWVCPGRPALAAALARKDAALSHRGDGVYGAMFVAALGAAIPSCNSLDAAIHDALAEIPDDSGVAAAVRLGRRLAANENAIEQLHDHYHAMSPVHTVNNLAVVIWALYSARGDFSTAIGNAVTAGWDTDCNGATVGGLAGLSGATIPDKWTQPWSGRIGLSLAGYEELTLDNVVARTVTVANTISTASH